MMGKIPPERPLKDRCEELVEEWRDRVEENKSYYHQSDVPVLLDELEALLDGEEP